MLGPMRVPSYPDAISVASMRYLCFNTMCFISYSHPSNHSVPTKLLLSRSNSILRIYTHSFEASGKNLTCNGMGSAAHDCTLCTRRPASARGFAPWMTPAGVDGGPNAGAVVSGRSFSHFCRLYICSKTMCFINYSHPSNYSVPTKHLLSRSNPILHVYI